MIAADSVENALRHRLLEADAPPAPKPLRVALPADLRNVMLRDLPENIKLTRGRLEISAPNTIGMLENLALLAQALQNDLDSAQATWYPVREAATDEDDDLKAFVLHLRNS